eukprot:8532246-Karenia_brevis.AAC.1
MVLKHKSEIAKPIEITAACDCFGWTVHAKNGEIRKELLSLSIKHSACHPVSFELYMQPRKMLKALRPFKKGSSVFVPESVHIGYGFKPNESPDAAVHLGPLMKDEGKHRHCRANLHPFSSAA